MMDAAVLHRQLASEGFKASERTARSKFAERKGRSREVFIRQSYESAKGPISASTTLQSAARRPTTSSSHSARARP